jgi:hypothetical protein
VLTIKKDDSLYANDSPGNFFDFLNHRHAESDSSFGPLQRIIVINRDVDDRDFFGRRPHKDHNANGRLSFLFAVEGKEGLGFVVAYANRKAARSLFNAGMAKARERIDNSVADTMLSRIEEQQILQF